MPFGKTHGTAEYLAKYKEQVKAQLSQTTDFTYLKKFKNLSMHYNTEGNAI